MTKMIEYDDNLFFINERAKLLEKGSALEIDPETYSEQFRQDMDIISRSLLQIRGQIDDSAHTIQRQENLRSLMLANQKAMELARHLAEKGYLSAESGRDLESLHKIQADELEEELNKGSEEPGDAEQVSPEEFEFLLKEENEENEIPS